MKFHFMKYRKLSYWISGILVALSILSLAVRGLNYGIDFSGGISMEVTPTSPEFTIDKMRAELSAFNPELQSVDGNSILVRVGLPKGATDAEQNARVVEIKNILGDQVQYSQVQIVGPKIGGELVRGGILAILVSFVLMSVYIWIRYRGGYAVGSFVSLILDFILMFETDCSSSIKSSMSISSATSWISVTRASPYLSRIAVSSSLSTPFSFSSSARSSL